MANKQYPIKIHLYFENGDPSGVCEAWMDNWSGSAYKIPRNNIEDKNIQIELKKPGVYFLFGKVGSETEVYIGESDEVGDRLKTHNKDERKAWFSEAVVVTSDKDYLNKANIKYLESVFHYEAIKAKRYKVENGNKPPEANVSKSDKAVLAEFIDKTKLLITALGYKVFEELSSTNEENKTVDMFYYNKNQTDEAFGYRHPEGFVLCKGSHVRKEQAEKIYPWIRSARELYLPKVVDGILTEDILFNSPSLAISFVKGYSINGNTAWKNAEGITFGKSIGIEEADNQNSSN